MATTTTTTPDVNPGDLVTVRKEIDGQPYIVTGQFLGLTLELDGSKLRILPADRVERRVPLPAEVRVHKAR